MLELVTSRPDSARVEYSKVDAEPNLARIGSVKHTRQRQRSVSRHETVVKGLGCLRVNVVNDDRAAPTVYVNLDCRDLDPSAIRESDVLVVRNRCYDD